MYATIPKMPRLTIEHEPIDIEKSKSTRQEALRDRRICMPSPNIADDGDEGPDNYLTSFLSLEPLVIQEEKNPKHQSTDLL